MPGRGPKVDRAGQRLGDRFCVEALIGKGAMAEVWRALDEQTGAHVALKVLRRSLDDEAGAKLRFQREGEVQARLRHRNVAAMIATGVTPHEEPYLVVELLRGKSLRSVLKTERALAPVRAASYAWQALHGLAAVHDAGVLHRDLKPANIMLEPSPGPVERVVLIDFGFATLEGAAKLTQQGTVVGSLTYIAPERLRGEPSDPRSDLYAVGVMLHEMLAGAPPFVAEDDLDLIGLHLHEPAPRLPAGFPGDLRDVVARALAKRQDDRYASAAQMADALEAAAQSL